MREIRRALGFSERGGERQRLIENARAAVGDAPDRGTLLLYGQLGAYRLDGAASTALLLLLLTLLTYAVIERVVGGRELH